MRNVKQTRKPEAVGVKKISRSKASVASPALASTVAGKSRGTKSTATSVLVKTRPAGKGAQALSEMHRGPLVQGGVGFLMQKYSDQHGRVVIERLVEGTGFTKKNLARTLGVSMDAMYRADRVNASAIQIRMREMIEILGRITEWAGGEQQALAWYRGQPIPAFGGRTAESLVKDNQAGPLRDYLDHLSMGGFA